MDIKKKLLLLFMLGVRTALSAQELHMLHWGVDEGLPGSTVYCSLQDRQGFMWFGTDQGLCRFDGTNFKSYTVAMVSPTMMYSGSQKILGAGSGLFALMHCHAIWRMA